jgi:hypothetical protein
MKSEAIPDSSLMPRPRPALSLSLGVLSLLLGPLTGVPAIVLGFRGLRQLREQSSKSGVRRWLCAGIVAGLFGSLLISGICFLTVQEIFWPTAGRRVDRIFRDIEQERFHERYDGLWPLFRDIAPESLYRAADERWPDKEINPYRSAFSSSLNLFGHSGNPFTMTDLRAAPWPIIVLGKPAVPHLFKWVKHREWYVRYVAIYALDEITKE